MKLWLLRLNDQQRQVTPGSNVGWVIRAEDEEEARRFADRESTGYHDEERNGQENYLVRGGHIWLDPTQTTAEELTNDGESGVVLVDKWEY